MPAAGPGGGHVERLGSARNGCASNRDLTSPVAAGEVTAVELNPLSISHTARTISCRASGAYMMLETVELGSPVTASEKPDASIGGTPMRPQTDNHRGMRLDT